MMSDDNREKIDVFEAGPWRYFKPAFVDGVMAGPNSILPLPLTASIE